MFCSNPLVQNPSAHRKPSPEHRAQLFNPQTEQTFVFVLMYDGKTHSQLPRMELGVYPLVHPLQAAEPFAAFQSHDTHSGNAREQLLHSWGLLGSMYSASLMQSVHVTLLPFASEHGEESQVQLLQPTTNVILNFCKRNKND